MDGRHRRALLGLSVAAAVVAPLPWLLGADRDAGFPVPPPSPASTRTMTAEEQARLCPQPGRGTAPDQTPRLPAAATEGETWLVVVVCDGPGSGP